MKVSARKAAGMSWPNKYIILLPDNNRHPLGFTLWHRADFEQGKNNVVVILRAFDDEGTMVAYQVIDSTTEVKLVDWECFCWGRSKKE